MVWKPTDQLNRSAPESQPQALVNMLSAWSGRPNTTPTPGSNNSQVALSIIGPNSANLNRLISGRQFSVRVSSAGAALKLKLKLNGKLCKQVQSIS